MGLGYIMKKIHPQKDIYKKMNEGCNYCQGIREKLEERMTADDW